MKRQEDFEKVKEEGKLFQAEAFAVAIQKREDSEQTKFGFVVSTKVSGMSTQRNRVKRALSEAVRHNLNLIGRGYNMVFLAKKSIIKKSTEEIMKEVESTLKKGLFRE